MPRRVDDRDLDLAVVALGRQPHGRVLGRDRDALLALQVAAVHDAAGDVLVGSEGAGLVQHRVDQGGLAVVDVGDDRDVAQVIPQDVGDGVGAGGGFVCHGSP